LAREVIAGEKTIVLFRQSTNIAAHCQLAKKGGKNQHEISRNHHARSRGSQPRRLRQQVFDDGHDFDIGVARLQQVSLFEGTFFSKARPAKAGLAFLFFDGPSSFRLRKHPPLTFLRRRIIALTRQPA
jgi:hypothetical protein